MELSLKANSTVLTARENAQHEKCAFGKKKKKRAGLNFILSSESRNLRMVQAHKQSTNEVLVLMMRWVTESLNSFFIIKTSLSEVFIEGRNSAQRMFLTVEAFEDGIKTIN